MKQVRGYEVKEYTYQNEEEREHHAAEMEEQGWKESGQIKRMKPGVHILDATENDYEWYAHFQRETNEE